MKNTKHMNQSRNRWKNNTRIRWSPPVLAEQSTMPNFKDVATILCGFFLILFIIAALQTPADIAYEDTEQRELYPLTSTIRDL